MRLTFELAQATHTEIIEADLQHCIVAGWAGRDLAAIEHHIEELAELGVPRPSAVPLYYRIAANHSSVIGRPTMFDAPTTTTCLPRSSML